MKDFTIEELETILGNVPNPQMRYWVLTGSGHAYARCNSGVWRVYSELDGCMYDVDFTPAAIRSLHDLKVTLTLKKQLKEISQQVST